MTTISTLLLELMHGIDRRQSAYLVPKSSTTNWTTVLRPSSASSSSFFAPWSRIDPPARVTSLEPSIIHSFRSGAELGISSSSPTAREPTAPDSQIRRSVLRAIDCRTDGASAVGGGRAKLESWNWRNFGMALDGAEAEGCGRDATSEVESSLGCLRFLFCTTGRSMGGGGQFGAETQKWERH